jgi:hypothetical protein
MWPPVARYALPLPRMMASHSAQIGPSRDRTVSPDLTQKKDRRKNENNVGLSSATLRLCYARCGWVGVVVVAGSN